MDFNDKVVCVGRTRRNYSFFIKKHKIVLTQKNDYKTMKFIVSKGLTNADKDENVSEIVKRIKNFLISMYEKCSNFNPTIFEKNIIKTNLYLRSVEDEKLSGGVVTIDKINTLKLYGFSCTEHELMHLASIKKDVFGYSGFNEFLEGYTDLITNRYFDDYNKISYPLESIFAKNIEVIFGKDYMESKFFNGKSFDIINDISKYLGEIQTQRLFYIISLINNKFIYGAAKFNIKEIQRYWDEVNKMLMKLIKNKYIENKNINEIDEILNNGTWVGTLSFKLRETQQWYKIEHFSQDKFKNIVDDLYNVSDSKTK